MKIGIAGPITLGLIDFDFKGAKVPQTYSFPLIANLVNALVKRGHQVVVFTTSDEIDEAICFKNEKITICIAKSESHPGRNFFRPVRRNLKALMQQYPTDIINAHWSYEFAWAAIDSGIPTVVTVRDHATTILKYQMIPYRAVRWIMNLIVLTKAKYLTTNSSYLKELLTKKQQEKAVVISNFYTTGLERHFLDSATKGNYIVSINNGFDRRKNVESGLMAFAVIRKKFPTLKYHLLGAFMETGSDAFQYAKKNNLLEGVEFIGYKPFAELLEEIKHAKLLLHTSREESFGNVVLEAMVVGTPVVGGKNSGNIPFLLLHGKAGEICDIDDPDDIAKSASKILNDEKYEAQLRDTAHKYAVENFSEESILTAYINQYKRVLENEK
ncbi:glycosyltransferase family 4 protein [Rhodocytophaga rosea]|uniref:Glycosyltransferase family 4 protein n=1 Tax=Rhodocytophaga rosea TaxID=2704465 RepID=A0A6C0GQB8_9BACT|nr:glycosyltransferase family 4 protein [Rhodocytophaga rosea]QHT69803.1 glycosyltransferase family 4 protein [Rhodocytophaga rosea]